MRSMCGVKRRGRLSLAVRVSGQPTGSTKSLELKVVPVARDRKTVKFPTRLR
jgi:hypothetical protein